MNTTPPANGHAPKSKKGRFLRNPTRAYLGGSNWFGFPSSAIDLAPYFTWLDIPRMLRDPRVRFVERMWRAPFQRVKWQVKANSPAVARFVGTTLRRFWRGSLPKILSRYFRYGYAPGGAEFVAKQGRLRLDRVRTIEPTDAQPLVWKDGPDRGQAAGFRLVARGTSTPLGGMAGGDSDSWISAPHAFWFSGYAELSPWYDMPPMAGMFEPWLEKRGRGGAIHIRRGWFRKCAYRGGVLHHPDGTTNMGTDESPREMDNADIARQTLEYSESGAVFTFTNELNPGENGKYAWDYEEPEAQPDVKGVREYPQDLDGEMLEGVGIPPEVLEAADVGSGWSGRLIPLMGFLGGVDELAGLTIEAADLGWMRHLVRVNYGPQAWYEIEPLSLAEEVQKQAQGGKDGGEGPNPIPDLFGGKGEEQDEPPRSMSWVSYTDTNGGRGWKNDTTGEIRYQEAMPTDGGDAGPADEHAGRTRQILRTFRDLPKRAVKKARDRVTNTYRKLEQRYGPGYAKLIVGAGVASLPVPIPGAAVAFAAPMLAVAELHKRLAKWNAPEPESIDEAGIVRPAARSFLASVFGKARGALHLSSLREPEPAHPHAEELTLAMAVAAAQGDRAALAKLGELADDDAALLEALGDAAPKELAWTAAPTRGGRGVKAVGTGEHAGRTLYGERAQAALRAQQRRKNPPQTARQRQQAEARARRIAAEKARTAGKVAMSRAAADPRSLTAQELTDLSGHLKNLTAEQLRTFARQVRAKISGPKAEVARRLITHVRTEATRPATASPPTPASPPPPPPAPPPTAPVPPPPTHASSGAVSGPYRKPQHVTFRGTYPTEQIKALFGGDVERDHLAAMSNAPDGSEVRIVAASSTRMQVETTFPGGYAMRTFHKDSRGNLVAHNDLFMLKWDRNRTPPPEWKRQNPTVNGTELLANQVKALRAAGVKRMETMACRRDDDDPNDAMNGYYTWPRLGYDDNIPSNKWNALPEPLKRLVESNPVGSPNRRSILSLMTSPLGRDWWKEHGVSLTSSKFDLSDGSLSMRTLEAYLGERGDRSGSGGGSQPASSPPPSPPVSPPPARGLLRRILGG